MRAAAGPEKGVSHQGETQNITTAGGGDTPVGGADCGSPV